MSIYKIILFLFLIFLTLFAKSQTANISIVPYTGPFIYGMNPGYWGPQLTNPQVGQLAANAGSDGVRVFFPGYFSETSNGTFANNDAIAYASEGFFNNVGFLGSPYTPNRLDSIFSSTSGNQSESDIWQGTYLPIWSDSANNIIDTSNKWATYVFNQVVNGGLNIKFWEIINEIDQTGDIIDAGGIDNHLLISVQKQNPTSWWNVNPQPNQLTNFEAPIYYYIHMLKISYEIIHREDPNSYVALGGIGYPSTLDVLLRNTDNPVDGSVTSQFPLTGGAYFDVISFHTYPFYFYNLWDNICGCEIYKRYSDYLVDVDTTFMSQYDSVQLSHGYGSIYPSKLYISTETDVPQDSLHGGSWGSLESAINYTIKWTVVCQARSNPVVELDKYALGSNPTNLNDVFSIDGLYGDITQPTTTVSNAPKTQEFYAYKTMTTLLKNKIYDPIQTASLNVPNNIRGYAFRDSSGNFTYVMWAKTTTDLSEIASATYTFPSFSGYRYEWDYSNTNSFVLLDSTQVQLSGSPTFFVTNQGPLSIQDLFASYNDANKSINIDWIGNTPKYLSISSDGKNWKSIPTTNNYIPMTSGSVFITAEGYNIVRVNIPYIATQRVYYSHPYIYISSSIPGIFNIYTTTGTLIYSHTYYASETPIPYVIEDKNIILGIDYVFSSNGKSFLFTK